MLTASYFYCITLSSIWPVPVLPCCLTALFEKLPGAEKKQKCGRRGKIEVLKIPLLFQAACNNIYVLVCEQYIRECFTGSCAGTELVRYRNLTDLSYTAYVAFFTVAYIYFFLLFSLPL